MAFSLNPKPFFIPGALAAVLCVFGAAYDGNAAPGVTPIVRHANVVAKQMRSELERKLIHQAAAIVDEDKNHVIEQTEWGKVYAFANMYIPAHEPKGLYAFDPNKLSKGLTTTILKNFVETYGAKLPAEKAK